MRSSTTAGVSLVEEAGIGMCAKDRVTGSIDNAFQRVQCSQGGDEQLVLWQV